MDSLDSVKEDNRRLRRTMRDLVALSTLPAIWTGLTPVEIARSLADALLNTLSLDLVFVRLNKLSSTPVEALRVRGRTSVPEQVTVLLNSILDSNDGGSPFTISDFLGAELRIAVTRFGVGEDCGVLLTGSKSAKFPTEEDRALLGVGANQTAIVIRRRLSEAQVLHERERLRVTLSSIGDAVITTDIDGNVTFLNPVAEEMTGWSQDEAYGRPLVSIFNIINEHTRLPATNPIADVLTRGVVLGLANHTVLISKHGREIGIEDSAAPIRDQTGSIIGAVLVFHDVTDKRAAQNALIESETRLSMAMEVGQMGAWEWIAKTNKVVWSPTLEAIHGVKPGSFGGTFDDFQRDIHPDDRDWVLQTIRQAYKERGNYRIEYRIIKPDNSQAWIEATGRAIMDAEGHAVGMSGICADVTLRKKAESALKRSEQFNRSIIESSQDCIKTLDLSGNLLWMNKRGQNLLCLSEIAQVVGKSWVDFWSDEDRPKAHAAVSTAARGGTGEFLGSLTLEGKQHWFEVTITPILAENGLPESLLAVSRDVTERRKAEEANLRLAAVVDFSNDAIVSKTLDGVIQSWNSGAQRMFGYSPDEVIGKPIKLLIPPDRFGEEDEILARLRRGERLESYETVRVRKDGSSLHVSLTVSPIKDSAGNVIGASKIARDITQQRAAAVALQEEARHLEILNSTGKAFASNLDLQSLVQTVTDAGTQLSGAKFGAFFYNVSNESGESFLLYTLSGAPREAFEKFGTPRNTPIFNPTFRGEGVLRSPDITKDPRYGTMSPHHGMPSGHLPVRSYLAVPVKLRSGEVIGGLFFGHPHADVFTDKTERIIVGIAAQAANAIDNARLFEARNKEIEQRKLAEQKMQAAKEDAERANRAKDEFLAIVSHELRTPLTSIMGWTRMLMGGGLDAVKTAHGIRVIERNVKLQTQLIEDLLDVSRSISGKLSLTITSVDLMRVVIAAIDSIKPAADAKEIKLVPINESGIGAIAGDAGRLQQIFWNLLANAVKFSPKQGKVEIRITQHDSTVRVTVTDNGVGIDKAFLPHVFDRFRQLDATTTRMHGGLGLGLAIVRHLVELHGGQVCAKSDGLGKGAQFIVELPIRAIAETASQKPASGEHEMVPQPLKGVKALVVEDENDSRDLILTVLESAGALGVGVSSVDEALADIRRRPPDVVISDIGMPAKDGYQLIRELRVDEKFGHVPVLALTAYAREEDRHRALSAGFDMHVAKPIDPLELIRRVRQLVR